ncbi:hypothetical protein JOC94_003387 [Bacillus thermophilus]|uniref:Uncharacterized protein n=1 Tax=Siminovitchia thermophila TaxID=1245522 RepID=A0ABS2R9P7_9BACI|nr:hypothetical protein [Siminovitchia thermophila]MBM7716367.1 hypothetical protein [Siminovitchia thermophila]ONK21999.1 hypothetical protein BLX87_19045 [Bacillus sp. VT-16-64]
MKKFKSWALKNDWWLPWLGVSATILGLLIPDSVLKGKLFVIILQLIKQHWLEMMLIGWGIFIHLEIRKLKKNVQNNHSADKIS